MGSDEALRDEDNGVGPIEGSASPTVGTAVDSREGVGNGGRGCLIVARIGVAAPNSTDLLTGGEPGLRGEAVIGVWVPVGIGVGNSRGAADWSDWERRGVWWTGWNKSGQQDWYNRLSLALVFWNSDTQWLCTFRDCLYTFSLRACAAPMMSP